MSKTKMVEIDLDGKKVEIQEGSMIMHAADKAGTYVPHFCYHKKLSIAANCRMCLVDVEKMPKPMPACATPVTNGMIVRTKSEKAIKAQQSVMEFLLINHPLDCPICDQGGECQLQDLAVGYGGSASRYDEDKRVVHTKDVGPLVSMQEMSRCIHCTRCIRFGQEVAGVMELGMSHRGEHSEIETFVGQSVDSELSGNMIDICPVGALTSKPFRYSARTWELSRRKSISPHDSTGANLIVQVKNDKVMRVVPLENEAVNECWIADRDRFSYEALNGDQRLTSPMIKQGGEWKTVDWTTALEYVATGIKQIKSNHGAQSVAALISPHCTLEELSLTTNIMHALGGSVDARLRHAEFRRTPGQVRWLGRSIQSLSSLDRVLVIGSNLRKDHPLFAQRIRQAVRRGCEVNAIQSSGHARNERDWAMPILNASVLAPSDWHDGLAGIAAAVAKAKSVDAPMDAQITDSCLAIARSLLSGERKAILLGNAASHHAQAQSLLTLANWIAENCNATVGYLSEAANTVGAHWIAARANSEGLNTHQVLSGKAKAVLLVNVEPGLDTASSGAELMAAQMVVSLSPFKANLEISDVVLPISPFTETSGSFVNAEGRVQSFHAVVKSLGDTRPGWKVLRVLANLLKLSGFEFESSQDVLAQLEMTSDERGSFVPQNWLDNSCSSSSEMLSGTHTPCTATIYQLDGLVRRAPSLQLTVDARPVATQGSMA